ncbi:MAG: HAMP domain-containing histidine kinase [Hymenobacter sp.]|nr:MAG: HAMP domain-containing histidine kinase [Hymenobacter sp.]
MAGYYGQAAGEEAQPGTARVQSLVQQATATARRQAQRLLGDNQQHDRLTFSQLLSQSTYPVFVFEQQHLSGWSAAGPLPTAADIIDTRPEWFAQTSLGDFVVVRQAAAGRVVLVYVPLAHRYGISNRYLRAGDDQALLQRFEVQVRPVTAATSRHRTAIIQEADGWPLFAVQWPQTTSVAGRYLSLGFLVLGMLLYTGGWLGLARQWWLAGHGGASVAALVVPLAILRAALLQMELPYTLLELPLFDPRVYAVASWAPSLGDLLLNALLALTAASGIWLLCLHYRWQSRAQAGSRLVWSMGLLLAFGVLLLWLHSYYRVAFSSSQLNLDITQSIQVTGFRLVLALAVVLYTAAFLLVLLLITRLLGPSRRLLRSRWLPAVLAGVAFVVLGLSVLLGWPWLSLAALAVGYLALVQAAGPARISLPYQLLLLLALGSATGALSLYEQFDHQLLLDKQRLSNNLLVDNDLQGEFLLGERIRQLAADPIITRLLNARPVRDEVLRRRISRQYLRDYFDKYEADINLFDAEGRPVSTDEADTLTFGQTREQLARTATATDQAGVFLLKSENSFSSRRYAAVVPLVAPPMVGIGPPAPAGTIVLTLSLRKLSSYSVLPELLVDQKFFQPGLATDLSYAGYAGGRLVYSEGDFDYANLLPATRLRDPRLYQTGLVLSGFHHLAVRGHGGRTVVVTTATYSLADWLSNFSFQLLLNSLLWLLAAGLYLLLRRERRTVQLNFSTRIQVLLNTGILLSLVVVSVATASQVISSYRRDLQRTYERRGRIALESLLRRRDLLADTASRPIGDPALASLVRNVAALTETDLNLYDAQGQLLVSSQPLIFEAGLLGPLLNPQAMVALRERGMSRALLTERAGSLSFNALYMPVRMPSSGDAAAGPLLGYVGIPFFDSQKALDNKLTELFTTILNIFTLMGLLFIALAFLATRQLTAPLKLLTERLRRTTLTGQNEVLAYQSSDDEIGLLVREYNAMLEKLAASKRELAAQEKEAAWREMARQVAHEIKNPLTPMKLSLQYLQKAINERRPNAEELIGRISQTLITQIDVLSDIATSFSTFTNLPTMRPERLDVSAVLQHCTDLFRQQDGDEDGALHLSLPTTSPCLVFADENLLVRTFNNLLLNAKQAVPPGRLPRQEVALRCEPGKVLITIADNGSGIAEDVQDKVFRPNFTTKATGSGIGLAVAKRGIESAGGRIWFDTTEGAGTTFFIELPLAG